MDCILMEYQYEIFKRKVENPIYLPSLLYGEEHLYFQPAIQEMVDGAPKANLDPLASSLTTISKRIAEN